MAYVTIPKDLTKVKNKVAFNLTKRQLICIGIGAGAGIPFYFLTRGILGNSNAATVMVLIMLPAFLFAMYEKDGMHLEEVLLHIIREEKLNPEATREFMQNAFRDGFLQINGTSFAKVLPPVSRFTPTGDRTRKRESVFEKLTVFFERFKEL